jgi:hypothetical protein
MEKGAEVAAVRSETISTKESTMSEDEILRFARIYHASEPERNYFDEAQSILAGTTRLLPEVRHLEALNEHYQSEIIQLVYDIEQVTKVALRRN